jgi:hypothetical protein
MIRSSDWLPDPSDRAEAKGRGDDLAKLVNVRTQVLPYYKFIVLDGSPFCTSLVFVSRPWYKHCFSTT